MKKSNIALNPSQSQLVNEINRVEQKQNRRFALRRVLSGCLTVAACAVLLLTLWFPVFSTDQGQLVLGMRTENLNKGELVVISRLNGISLCRIIALSGDQTDLLISFPSQVPAGYLLIELVTQDAQNYHLVRQEEIVAKVIFSILPMVTTDKIG